MLSFIRDRFENKSVVFLGFGREGQASYRVFRKVFPEKRFAIADKNEQVSQNPLVAGDSNLDFITGMDYLERLSHFDVILRSPGIPLWNSSLSHKEAISSTTPSETFSSPWLVTSQTDLFLQAFSRQVIGVTGTKGKSTTSGLIHHILKTAGKDALLVGNIGNPAFHFLDQIKPETNIVYELSSHQLEYLTKAPHISVLLNFFQEHLDAYRSFEDYQLAKINIARYQGPQDILVFNTDEPLVVGQVAPYRTARQCYPFSVEKEYHPGGFIREGMLFFADGKTDIPVWKIHQERYLRGMHNLKNILAAVNVAMVLGISTEAVEEGIATFKGLGHRLEYVGEQGGVHFYNDSIATIPEACIEAIKAIPKVDTLIAGGFDRGVDYSGLGDFLSKSEVRNFIFSGAAGKRIGECLEAKNPLGKKIFYIPRFDDFRAIAFRETLPGYTCLLSPAAASYDEFNNFEERGNRFKMLVNNKL